MTVTNQDHYNRWLFTLTAVIFTFRMQRKT
jgi:hypothetical protein